MFCPDSPYYLNIKHVLLYVKLFWPLQLDAADVRLVGVSLEDIMPDSNFAKQQYWTAELYMDPKKQCYKDLGLVRPGMLNTIKYGFFSKEAIQQYAEARKEKIPINLKGDMQQNGGIIVVTPGGKEFRCFTGQKVTPFLGLCHSLTASLCASFDRHSPAFCVLFRASESLMALMCVGGCHPLLH